MKNLLGTAEERILVRGVAKMADLAAEESPTDAAVKVAKELGLNRHMATRMCVAYNTGYQNAQRKSNVGLLGKFASFETADPEAVSDRLHLPVAEKNASESAEPTPVEFLEKYAAQVPASRVSDIVSSLSTKKKKKRKKKTNLVGDKSASYHRRELRVEKALGPFKSAYREACQNEKLARRQVERDVFLLRTKLSQSNQTAEAVEWNSGNQYGTSEVRSLFDVATPAGDGVKRADFKAPPSDYRVPDFESDVYRQVRQCIKSAESYVAVSKVKSGTLDDAATMLRSKVAEELPEIPVDFDDYSGSDLLKQGSHKKSLDFHKAAAGFMLSSLAGSAVGSLLGQARKSMEATPDPVQDALQDLSDPSQDAELMRLRAELVLNDVLSSDDTLSGYDPNDITRHYKELTTLSPDLATQPALLRPALRRALQGNMEVFEGQQLAEAGKAVNDASQSRMSYEDMKSPSPLLGGVK